MSEVKGSVLLIQDDMHETFGCPENPLLISVRSGAAVSMPGMMDTVLNLGLNDEIVLGLAKQQVCACVCVCVCVEREAVGVVSVECSRHAHAHALAEEHPRTHTGRPLRVRLLPPPAQHVWRSRAWHAAPRL
jgi:hypothetical protein